MKITTEILLEVSNLCKNYHNLIAVSDLSLKLEKGKIHGLLGPNGAGKSTTIKMLCRLLKPDSGQVEIPKGVSIGYCPQENILWDNLTCAEQIRLMGRLHNVPPGILTTRTAELLQIFAILKQARVLARNLSGGMKRKLNIILTLIHDPEVVIMDEPEAGLDARSRVQLREYIKVIAGLGKSVLLTGHNIFEIEQVADYVYIMESGNIVARGKPAELIRQHTLNNQPCRNLEDLFISLTGRSLTD